MQPVYCVVSWCFCFMECLFSGSCLNFHWIPTSYGSCSKLSDVSRCFYYEFWRERVYCFRLAIPLKGTTHSSRQHSFCKFLSKRSKLSHPSSLPSGLTHPSLLPLFFFLEYSYSISWLSAMLHGMPYVGITYWLWLPGSSLITSRGYRGCYWMHCLCLWDFLSLLWI